MTAPMRCAAHRHRKPCAVARSTKNSKTGCAICVTRPMWSTILTNEGMHHAPLVLTAGEPAGIGPDLCVQMAQQTHPALVVIADSLLLQQRAAQTGLPLKIGIYEEGGAATRSAGELTVLPIPLQHTVTAG